MKLPQQESLAYVQSRTWFTPNPLDAAAASVTQDRSWSDYWWVLLIFVAMLLLEQYLAKKFSHHLKEAQVQTPQATPRPVSAAA